MLYARLHHHKDLIFRSVVDSCKMACLSLSKGLSYALGFTLLCILFSPLSYALYPPEIQSLFDLRTIIAQNKNVLPHWFSSNTPPCNWAGIICDGPFVREIHLPCNPHVPPLGSIKFPSIIGEFSHLRHLNLSQCGFTGSSLPPNIIYNLTSLETLDLTGNNLSGPMPPSISDIKRLRVLVLDGNSFSGRLPSSIGLLGELEELSLHMSGFSGTLPPEIGNLVKLQSLDLGANSFSGYLPSSLGNLSSLQFFDGSQNRFSGPIFPGIGNLSQLQIIDLSSNSLRGLVPSEVGRLVSLKSLNLANNDLSGVLPSTLGNLGELEKLHLQSCNFEGDLPEGISKLVNLTYLNIAQNTFDAALLPSGIGNLTKLGYLIAHNSGLRGPIPDELGKCRRLQVLDLSSNSLSGPLPYGLSRLESIDTLFLGSNVLSGSIPSWISNLKRAVTVTLSKNRFTGSLPTLRAPSLSFFDASSNMLSGQISSELCDAAKSSLEILALSDNSFNGTIDNDTFRGCVSLTNLILSGNNLSGQIPGYLGSELQLVILELSQNKFSGELPSQLWESKTFMEVSLNDNLLSGSISPSIGNLAKLQRLQLDNNLLEGAIPSSLGQLKNLTNLSLHGNLLSGEIPLELFNCTGLVSVDLGGNRLTGQIPKAISQLKRLDNLVLSGNHLSGQIPEEICSGFQEESLPDSEFIQHYGMLDLSDNEFSGPIPSSISQCIVVTQLLVQRNNLTGKIPSLSGLLNLTSVDMSFNNLNGTALPQFLGLRNLQGLVLSHNQLTGSIPDNISLMLPSLTQLDLSCNQFAGDLPTSLFSMDRLTYLELDSNSFTGSLPCDIGTISSTSLVLLNISDNKLEGRLCDSLSNLATLSVLDLHSNGLSGQLPASLSSLNFLTYLDLSNNKFDESVPRNICKPDALRFINFSGNQLSGYVPENCPEGGDPFTADIPSSIPPKSTPSSHPPHVLSKAYLWGIVICASFIFLGALLMGTFLGKNVLIRENMEGKLVTVVDTADSSDELLGGKKLKEPLSINIATFQHSLTRLQAADILSATENFSKTYVIGDGGFGTVYKASLLEGRTMAVKRLNNVGELHGDREFLAEMETVGKVQHENLVPLYGYCVFGEERFLIYEYMENGSLDVWLRNRADAVEFLDWPTRFKICLGSARGIAFLHHGFVPHIIHRDIKSSNILLDGKFEPKVSDFGLARIISACESHVSTVLAGTFGYIPPEYGQRMTATIKGDVYSFGVVMLELVTGMAPTGQTDREGGNLVGWVRLMVGSKREEEVIDPCFTSVDVWKKQILRVLGVARMCTSDDPRKRPTMKEVVKLLGEITP